MLLVKEKDANLDEFFDKAINACLPYDAISAGFLQRRMSIRYARAARLLDQLEDAGVVSPANGLEPRKVLALRNKKSGKLDTSNFLLANAQLITNVFSAHNIAVRLVRITVQKENILFLFDFDIKAKIDDVLKLDKEIATALASPTGKVEMGAPFKGTSLLFIYLPIKKK